jgi:hypothetical protein
MGIVYKARHVPLNRLVALKMILGGDQVGGEELQRFLREARAVARLQHPNVVQIYEVGEHGGQPYLSLEFVEGESLDRKLAGGAQPVPAASELVETLARAMHAAHQRGVVHRDLKPANILVTADGVPKITDFGLAKHLDEDTGQTRTGAILGTPSYMAPEQAGGRRQAVGPAADVHALGAILYELLTGRPPFRAETPLDTVMQVVHEEPLPPSRLNPKVPGDLQTICLKCLRKDPGRRYPSAESLAEDLRRFRAGEPIHARPTPVWERGWMWARRRPAIAVPTLLVLVGTVPAVVTGLWMWPGRDPAGWRARAARPATDEGRAAERRTRPPTDPVTEQLRSKLTTPVVLEKGVDANTPLRDLLEFLSDRFEVVIALDAKAFKAEGATGEMGRSPVQLPPIRGAIRLDSVLEFILCQLDPPGGYVLRGDRVIVTTRRQALAEAGETRDSSAR